MEKLTDTQLLENIQYILGVLLVMRICDWLVISCKTIHDWLSSMFSSTIDKR